MNRSERLRTLWDDPGFRAKHKASLAHRRPRGEVKAEKEEREKRRKQKRAEKEERRHLREEKKRKKEDAREYVDALAPLFKSDLPPAPYCEYCGESFWCEHNIAKKTLEQNNF